MPNAYELDLQFPIGGLDRSAPYQSQPPYTTPACQNMRPRGSKEQRLRGGTRPGTTKFYEEELGSGSPIRFIDSVRVNTTDGYRSYVESFSGDTLSSQWSALTGFDDQPRILPDDLDDVQFDVSAGALLASLAIDATQTYFVEMHIVPFEGFHWGSYTLYTQMNNSTPNPATDTIKATLDLVDSTTSRDDGYYAGTVSKVVSSSATDSSLSTSTTGSAEGGWFRMVVKPTDVEVYWQNTRIDSTPGFTAISGNLRIGMSFESKVDGGLCLVDQFRVGYYEPTSSTGKRDVVVAASNGSLYRDEEDKMIELTTDLGLVSSTSLVTDEYAQKLFIADFEIEPAITSSNGSINTVSGEHRLSDSGIADFTAESINQYDYVVVVTNASGANDGTYGISSISSGYIVLNRSPFTTGSSGSCSYTVERAPKIYDPVADTLSIWSTAISDGSPKGHVPSGCDIVFRYRARVGLAGGRNWYMSRVDDYTDFDYAPADIDNPLRAVAATNAEAGLMGDVITAAFALSDDYMIFAGSHSLYRLSGDPAYGGQLDQVSENIGIVGRNAWCRGPGGEVVFLSYDGLYVLHTNGFPESISVNRIPNDLRDINTGQNSISLAYDPFDDGVHIFITDNNNTGSNHWWFDWQTRSFWPVQLPSAQNAYSLHTFYSETGSDRRVLLGCHDGYIRSFDRQATNDDGTAIESHVFYGPFKTGPQHNAEGRVEEITATLGALSGRVNWDVFTSNTGRGTVKGYSETGAASGVLTRGDNYTARPRRRARYFSIRLKDDGHPWEVDSLSTSTRPLAPYRK